MKKLYFLVIISLTIFSKNSMNAQVLSFEESLKITQADYGTCYQIGEFMLCPEKKLIRVGKMFGTATKDCFGYFPEPKLKYDAETMIIFAGNIFFDKSDLNIDWKKVELLSYESHYSEFTDGKTLYYIQYGDVHKKDKYNKNTYIRDKKEKPEQKYFDENYGDEIEEYGIPVIDTRGRKALGADNYVSFYVYQNTFYYEHYPVLESFDVANLRTIVSKNGFETDFATDGKQMIFCGSTGSYTSTEKNGEKYAIVEKLIIEGVDLPSLRVLGRDILADKNAIYYRNNVIPFDKLNGFKFTLIEFD